MCYWRHSDNLFETICILPPFILIFCIYFLFPFDECACGNNRSADGAASLVSSAAHAVVKRARRQTAGAIDIYKHCFVFIYISMYETPLPIRLTIHAIRVSQVRREKM